MSRILAYTSPARGHLFPVTPILDELHRRGHEVAVRTLASEVTWLSERGFDAAPIDRTVETIELDDYLGRTPMGSVKRAVQVFARRAPFDAEDLQRAIDDVQPTAVMVDINTWGASAVAEASGLPWATWCPYPLPVPSRDAPPFGPGLAPARGLMGRLRDAVLRPVVVGMMERTFLPDVNDLRTGLGLSPVDSLRELYGAPQVLLYLTAEPFEYPRSDWPSNVRMVGPCAWDPPVDPPGWLDDIDAPLVLVTTSSEFQDDARLAEVALEALADEDVHVVATVPSASPQFQTPANAHVESFVPHGPVLDRAICAVTHGGMGATQKALANGVPVCAVPFGRDQLEVARRVEQAGAGTRLPVSKLRPDRLREAVRQATAHKSGAEQVARGYRDAGGPEAAADHIEEALTRPQVTR